MDRLPEYDCLRNYGNACDTRCQYSGFLRAFQKAFIWKKIFHGILSDPDVLHRWSDPDLPGSTEISSAGYLLGYGCSVLLVTYYIIVGRTFFNNSIPEDLWEAAQLDGCGYLGFFFKIVLPLSKAVIAVIALWAAVGQWNSYFNALIYIRSESLQPLQIVLRSILVGNQTMSAMSTGAAAVEAKQMADLIKYAIIVVSSAPIMCMYPLVQKYFNQGVMLGSLKG